MSIDAPRLCDFCSLLFHTGPFDGKDDCGCLKHDCGCRIKREREIEEAG